MAFDLVTVILCPSLLCATFRWMDTTAEAERSLAVTETGKGSSCAYRSARRPEADRASRILILLILTLALGSGIEGAGAVVISASFVASASTSPWGGLVLLASSGWPAVAPGTDVAAKVGTSGSGLVPFKFVVEAASDGQVPSPPSFSAFEGLSPGAA